LELNWFKLSANFDKDDRVSSVENSRGGAATLYQYIKLYCIAVRCANGGGIFLADNIPHTSKTLAKQWRCKEITVKNTLETLLSVGLIEELGGIYRIADWEEAQAVDKLEEIRENARLRKRKSRERLALEAEKMSRDRSLAVTPCHSIEEDIEKEKEKDLEIEGEEDIEQMCREIAAEYNAAAVFPQIKILSEKQKGDIAFAVKQFGKERLTECFGIAAKSEFLRGKNSKCWVASFDWLIKPESIAKVLNGNYDTLFQQDTDSSFEIDEFTAVAAARGFEDIL